MASCIPEQLLDPAQEPAPAHSTAPVPSAVDQPTDAAATGDAASSSGEAAAPGTVDRPTSSVFARGDNAPVHVVPMRVIHRPLPSELDEDKVLAFMEEMKVSVAGGALPAS